MAKSPKNKTIDMNLDECGEFYDRCLVVPETAQSLVAAQPPQSEQQSPENAQTTQSPVSAQAMQPLKSPEILDKTINGDSFSVLPLLPKNFADLLIADPPYNLTKNYGGHVFAKTDIDSYRTFTESWLLPSLQLLKKSASLYICCDWESSIVIGNVLADCQQQGLLTVQNRITWQREKGRGASANWKNSMEDIWFATVSDNYTFNLDDVKIRRKVVAPYKTEGQPKDWEETKAGNFRNTCPGNFWDDISIPYWSMPENTAHPTQKPEKLVAKLILASSNSGDVVFDPFLGSGTTSVTAKKLGRHYCGIERNPQYCAWAEYRLHTADTNKTIQGYSDGVFWERNTSALQKSSRGAK